MVKSRVKLIEASTERLIYLQDLFFDFYSRLNKTHTVLKNEPAPCYFIDVKLKSNLQRKNCREQSFRNQLSYSIPYRD